MSFSTRCPECRVKLRLENAPEAGETVECPKCGSTFVPDEPLDEPKPAKRESSGEEEAPRRKKKKKKKKEKEPQVAGAPRKRIVKKKKTNPVLLYAALGSALVFVSLVSVLAFFYFTSAGSVEEMLYYVPGECNMVRGVDVRQMNKFPGFTSEMEPFVTGQVKSMANDLAVATGLEDGEDVMGYVVIGKSKKAGSSGVVYVFRTKKKFPKANPLDTASNMSPQDSGGVTSYRSNGKDLLAGAVVFTPSNRLIVVIPKGAQQQAMVSAVAAGGAKNKDQMFAGKAGDTAKRVSKGQIWTVVRPEGPLQNFAKDMGSGVKTSLPALASACEKAKSIGWWTSYSGSYIYFGGAVECENSTSSYELKKTMNDGEFGKQDDATVPNDVKKAVPQSGSKEFTEFLAWLKFNYSGSTAFFTAKMSINNGKSFTRIFNSSSTGGWDDDSSSGAGGGGFIRPGQAGGGR